MDFLTAGKRELRHYRSRANEAGDQVWLLFELKIDLQDVRSGYRDSAWGLYLAAPWLEDKELDWTLDMVRRFEPGDLEEVNPLRHFPWPDFADQKMVGYLVRYYRPQSWKNSGLGLFSHAREGRDEFLARCRDSLREERERGLKKVRELFYHRFVEMEQRLLEGIEQQDHFDEQWRARRMSEIRDLFNRVGEDLSRRFLDVAQRVEHPVPVIQLTGIDPESLQKLRVLREEFVDRYNQVLADYERQASEIERYEVRLAYPQIEIVSRSILWG